MQIEERKGKKGPYWRVLLADGGRERWLTCFERPDFRPGEEVEYQEAGGRLIRALDPFRGHRYLARALLILCAVNLGAGSEDEALAMAEEMERWCIRD